MEFCTECPIIDSTGISCIYSTVKWTKYMPGKGCPYEKIGELKKENRKLREMIIDMKGEDDA